MRERCTNNMAITADNKTLENALNTPLCECGCGQQVKYDKYHSRRYIHGHHRRGKHMLLKTGMQKRFRDLPRICKTCNKDIPLNQRFLYAPQQCTTCRSNTWVKDFEAKKPKRHCKCGCGTLIPTTSTRARPKEYVHGHKGRKPRKYKTHNKVFKGGNNTGGKIASSGMPGILVNNLDQVLVKVKDHPRADKLGYVTAQILLMEEQLNRYLYPWEYVEHINGLARDNRLQNLRLRIRHTVKIYNKLYGGHYTDNNNKDNLKLRCNVIMPHGAATNICAEKFYGNDEALKHMREKHGLFMM